MSLPRNIDCTLERYILVQGLTCAIEGKCIRGIVSTGRKNGGSLVKQVPQGIGQAFYVVGCDVDRISWGGNVGEREGR